MFKADSLPWLQGTRPSGFSGALLGGEQADNAVLLGRAPGGHPVLISGSFGNPAIRCPVNSTEFDLKRRASPVLLRMAWRLDRVRAVFRFSFILCRTREPERHASGGDGRLREFLDASSCGYFRRVDSSFCRASISARYSAGATVEGLSDAFLV